MAAFLFLTVLTASFLVIRLGAVAFEMTGLSWDESKFQALSTFTNTGFTTREAELITTHPIRRKIASYLIVAGNAGLVTTIGSFAGTVAEERFVDSLANVAVIIAGAAVIVGILRRPGVSKRIRVLGERWLGRRFKFDVVPSAAELLRLDQGFSLERFRLPDDCPATGHTLSDLELKERNLQILAIERGPRFIPIPSGHDRLNYGDCLIVYGDREALQNVFQPADEARIPLAGTAGEMQAP